MRLLFQAGDSHEMPGLIFFENKNCRFLHRE